MGKLFTRVVSVKWFKSDGRKDKVNVILVNVILVHHSLSGLARSDPLPNLYERVRRFISCDDVNDESCSTNPAARFVALIVMR